VSTSSIIAAYSGTSPQGRRTLGRLAGHGVGARGDRAVNGVVAQHDKERPLAVPGDEGFRLALQPIGQVFAGGRRRQPDSVIGAEHRFMAAEVVAGEIDVEALVLREETRAAEVPFADAGGGVAAGAEGLGERGLREGKLAGVGGRHDLAAAVPLDAGLANRVGHAAAGRPAPGEKAGPGGRANRGGRVGVGEAHAFAGQPIDVRRADVRVAVAGEIAPAEIVDQEEDEVDRRGRCGGGGRRAGGTESGEAAGAEEEQARHHAGNGHRGG
jgi:hypothetical protein